MKVLRRHSHRVDRNPLCVKSGMDVTLNVGTNILVSVERMSRPMHGCLLVTLQLTAIILFG